MGDFTGLIYYSGEFCFMFECEEVEPGGDVIGEDGFYE